VAGPAFSHGIAVTGVPGAPRAEKHRPPPSGPIDAPMEGKNTQNVARAWPPPHMLRRLASSGTQGAVLGRQRFSNTGGHGSCSRVEDAGGKRWDRADELDTWRANARTPWLLLDDIRSAQRGCSGAVGVAREKEQPDQDG